MSSGGKLQGGRHVSVYINYFHSVRGNTVNHKNIGKSQTQAALYSNRQCIHFFCTDFCDFDNRTK